MVVVVVVSSDGDRTSNSNTNNNSSRKRIRNSNVDSNTDNVCVFYDSYLRVMLKVTCVMVTARGTLTV